MYSQLLYCVLKTSAEHSFKVNMIQTKVYFLFSLGSKAPPHLFNNWERKTFEASRTSSHGDCLLRCPHNQRRSGSVTVVNIEFPVSVSRKARVSFIGFLICMKSDKIRTTTLTNGPKLFATFPYDDRS